MSSLNIVGSDVSAALLREVARVAGTAVPAAMLLAERDAIAADRLSDDLASAFLNHRIFTHLLRQLELAGLDLSSLHMDPTIWHRCSTSTVVRAVPPGPGRRIAFDEVGKRLDHHRELQRRVMTTLALEVPGSFMVMFGQGISLAHPEYGERFSHDIDLVVSDPDSGHAIVAILNGLGFETGEARSGTYRGVPFHDWTLDASDLDGHRMHVDLSTGAITRSDGWMKPVVIPDLLDAALSVPLWGSQTRVLVPTDTHQLLLLAEKTQRTQRYDCRVRADASVLQRLGRLDLDFVVETARTSSMSSTLGWLLWKGEGEVAPRRTTLRTGVGSLLISLMARGTHNVPRSHAVAAKAFRRVCR